MAASVPATISRALCTRLGAPGIPCSRPFSSIQPRSLLAGRQRLSAKNSLFQLDFRLNVHTLPKRTSGPLLNVPALFKSQQQPQLSFQQRSRLGRQGFQIRTFAQSSRWWQYSYQRFGGRGTGGFPQSRAEYIWAKYKQPIIGGGLVIGGFYLYNLEEVPVTGRRRFNCISESQEMVMGEESYRQLMQELRGRILPDSHPYVRKVGQVLQRLIAASEAYDPRVRDYKWTLHVIADDEKNAFVLPGGKVFVHAGILPLCGDDNGLAAVLGHEIAHVILRHPGERMSSNLLTMIAVFAVSALFDVSAQLPSFAFNVLFSLPHSRSQESEADRVGLMIMAKSCYRPEAALKFWDRMRHLGQAAPPELISTHPSSDTRIASIQKWMYEAQTLYEDSGCDETLWNDFLRLRS
ncbi:hypothetical protein VTO42DRAFT_350 [Malbranchea cinnamomea]